MFGKSVGVCFRPETRPEEEGLQEVAVVPGRLPLPEAQDVGQNQQERDNRDPEGGEEGGFQAHQEGKEGCDGRTDPADQPPDQVAFQAPGASGGIRGRVGIGQSEGRVHEAKEVRRQNGEDQNVPTPTEELSSMPKILKKAKIRAGAAAMIAPPMIDILP